MGCLDCCVVSADDFIPAYKRWENHPARQDWEPIKDLGSGSFSSVVLARHIITGALAALKVVFLDNPELDRETEAMLAQEGDLLLQLSHPNLVSCSQVIKSPAAHVLVLEYLKGCSVLDGLSHISEVYTERDAWGVFYQLASAVAYLHSRLVIHRDIKPENLVYVKKFAKPVSGSTIEDKEKQGPPIVKLIDLGMSWRYDPNINERGVLGSAGFVAPEIIKGGIHTPAMDVFSMGVLLFIMLVGRKPFNIEDSEKLRYAKMGLAAAPGLKDPRWLDLSPDAKHLLMGMLTFDPERRLTAAQVLEHEWVTTKGGRVLRMLGMDVALGAATVAEMRRLRFLCNGVVAMRRIAFTVEKQNQSRKNKKKQLQQQISFQKSAPAGTIPAYTVEEEGEGSCKEHEYYLENLRRMQRRESSVRNGGNRSFRGIARTITAASYRQIHDAGGSVHYGDVAIPKANTGMRKSATALLLSDLLAPASEFGSVHGGSVRSTGGRSGSFHNGSNSAAHGLSQSTSGLALLGASLRQYMDVSMHGATNGNSAVKQLPNANIAPRGNEQSPQCSVPIPISATPKDVDRTTSVSASSVLTSPPTTRTIVVKKRGSFDTSITPASLLSENNSSSALEKNGMDEDGEHLKLIEAGAAANNNGLEKKLHGRSRNSLDVSFSPTKSTNSSGSVGRKVQVVKPLAE